MAHRDQSHFRGEPDAFKGDALNQRVRDTAKETMDALYNATAPPPASYGGSGTRVRAVEGEVAFDLLVRGGRMGGQRGTGLHG
eukprot:366469-Chlamydomonas_euryale.AAC.2